MGYNVRVGAALVVLALMPLSLGAESLLRLSNVPADSPMSDRAVDGELALTMDDLLAMPRTELITETIWTAGEQRFTGVQLVDLLASLGVEPREIVAYAVNDYIVDIPPELIIDGGALMAYERNGRPMSVRDKGPLWVVFPFDQNPDYQTEFVFSRSIWQLLRIDLDPPY